MFGEQYDAVECMRKRLQFRHDKRLLGYSAERECACNVNQRGSHLQESMKKIIGGERDDLHRKGNAQELECVSGLHRCRGSGGLVRVPGRRRGRAGPSPQVARRGGRRKVRNWAAGRAGRNTSAGWRGSTHRSSCSGADAHGRGGRW